MNASFWAPHLLSLVLGALAWATVQWLRRAQRNRRREFARSAGPLTASELVMVMERFRISANDAGLSFWEWDVARDEVLTYVHMTAQDMHEGAGRRCARQQYIEEAVHPEDRTAFSQLLDEVVHSRREHFAHRCRVRSPRGYSHVQFQGHTFRDERGAVARVCAITLDVTEQSAAAARLETQTHEQATLLHHMKLANKAAGCGVWRWEIPGDRFTADMFIARALGMSEVDIRRDVRAFFNAIVHPEDCEHYNRDLDAALAGGDSYTSRYRLLQANAAPRYVRAHAYIERDMQGVAVRMLGVTLDITGETLREQQLQRQAEEERALRDRLRAQAAQLQLLADRIGVAAQVAGLSVWETDPRADELVWVGNRIRAFGLEELPLSEYGRALNALMHPDDRDALLEAGRKAFEDGRESYSYRFRLMRDGITRTMHTFVHVVRDAQGEPMRLVGATQDVTNEVQTTELLQRQAEQERELVERLNLATQAAAISSWEYDLGAQRFLWVDRPLLEPQPGQELTFAELSKYIHEEDREIFNQSLRTAMEQDHERAEFRMRLRHPMSGALMYVQNQVLLIRAPDGRQRILGVAWDVTREVLDTERLQRQSEHERYLLERLSLATEAAGIAPWELDLKTRRFAETHEALLAVHRVDRFGGSMEEFLSHLHPDDREPLVASVYDAIARRQERWSNRYRLIGENGKILHIQTHARVLLDSNRVPAKLMGISWDVTNEIEAAEQLRDAERRLERASLSSMEGHWEYDLTTHRVWYSTSYHTLLGYADGELPRAAAEFVELVHPDDRERCQRLLREHLRSNAQFVVDYRLRTRTGEYRWVRQRGMAERNASGRAVRLSGSIHDIHQQRQVELVLGETQARFERAITGTQDGLWELDARNETWSSPRLGQLLGYAPEEWRSDVNFFREHLHPEDAPTLEAVTQAHFNHDQPYDAEVRLRTKSGEYRWYRARASAERDANGQPLRLSGSLQDVTDARAAREQLLRATQAAESANRAKSEFLANVSHEIRTPLNGVIGMTGLLLDTPLDRTQRDYADTIRTSADSLLTVINDILDFSKIEAGKLDIEQLDLDVRAAVEDAAGMMAFQAAAKGLELIVNFHPDTPEHVVGDPQRLRQCLLNLIGNAVKFTERGEIVVEAAPAGDSEGRRLVRFEVRDTGIGIAQETLAALFQPFVQADSSTTRHFGGTGLGLSIVRRLVEMMGGAVGASSEPGRGSCFWFTLPFELQKGASSEAPIDLARLGRRVLVIDDNETNRRVLAGQLMRAGYEVSLAATGIEAITLMRRAVVDEYPYEVVLADGAMQDMNGAALGERINADPQLAQSRLVMLTSMDRQGDLERFAQLGFAGYLTKPVRGRELLDCLDRVLSRAAREWHLQSQPLVTRAALVGGDARRYNGRVLLVEDNAVNQKVAVRFLERLGCTVRVADNGAEGVKAFENDAFDMIFMDLQMPVMDGLSATRRIRELEGGGERRTPIIALTANAMAGQLERCLEAGMDGFLSKPIDVARLHETLEHFGMGAALTPPTAASEPAPEAPVAIARLQELTDGDAEFEGELTATFIASGEQVLREIAAAMRTFDRAALSRAAHKLKGASANIHAEALRESAYHLETQAAQVDQQRLAALAAEVSAEFQRAADFLRARLEKAHTQLKAS